MCRSCPCEQIVDLKKKKKIAPLDYSPNILVKLMFVFLKACVNDTAGHNVLVTKRNGRKKGLWLNKAAVNVHIFTLCVLTCQVEYFSVVILTCLSLWFLPRFNLVLIDWLVGRLIGWLNCLPVMFIDKVQLRSAHCQVQWCFCYLLLSGFSLILISLDECRNLQIWDHGSVVAKYSLSS